MTWVTRDTKIRFAHLAHEQGYSESAFDSVAIRRHAPVARARGRSRYANQHLRVALVVGAIGRNLNQIARAVNRGETPTGPSRADLQALLRALTGLRDHFKALITANLESWKIGYEKASYWFGRPRDVRQSGDRHQSRLDPRRVGGPWLSPPPASRGPKSGIDPLGIFAPKRSVAITKFPL
jgi:hypothetical protein